MSTPRERIRDLVNKAKAAKAADDQHAKTTSDEEQRSKEERRRVGQAVAEQFKNGVTEMLAGLSVEVDLPLEPYDGKDYMTGFRLGIGNPKAGEREIRAQLRTDGTWQVAIRDLARGRNAGTHRYANERELTRARDELLEPLVADAAQAAAYGSE